MVFPELKKTAYVISTAAGYDLVVFRRNAALGTKVRVHTSITAASMRRFYVLCGTGGTFRTTHELPWRRLFSRMR